MSIEKVREYFKKWNMENRIMEFDVSSATVELAAKALNCEPARIAKTLALKAADEGVILIVAAGDAKIDNQKFKAKFGIKRECFPLTRHWQWWDIRSGEFARLP